MVSKGKSKGTQEEKSHILGEKPHFGRKYLILMFDIVTQQLRYHCTSRPQPQPQVYTYFGAASLLISTLLGTKV